MRLFIAEDEAPARERLAEAIARVAPQARVVGSAGSVRETRAWLAANEAPDLLLLDIQLADGLSLDLFREDPPDVPAVFTTAYDEFVLEAFRAQAIDYLLKPVDEARLAEAFAKRERLQRHFGAGVERLLERLQPAPAPRWRTRVIGRQGARHVAVPLERAACFVSVDKLAFVVTDAGERYLLDGPLADLERELDPARFFRANRQCVVSAQAVQGFKPADRGRLLVTLAPASAGDVVVSQERAAAFRAWLAA